MCLFTVVLGFLVVDFRNRKQKWMSMMLLLSVEAWLAWPLLVLYVGIIVFYWSISVFCFLHDFIKHLLFAANMPLTKHLKVSIVDSNPALLITDSFKRSSIPDSRVSSVTPATISFFKGCVCLYKC